MSGGCLRYLVVRHGLHRVYQIGKEDCVLYEENRDVVADDIYGILPSARMNRVGVSCRIPKLPSSV